MKTKPSETEVNRVAVDAITLSLQKLPYNAQNEADRTLAEHFLLRELDSKVGARVRKLDEKVKAAYKDGATDPVLTENYRLEITKGEPRSLFDLDMFIDAVVNKYPAVMAHELRQLSTTCKKHSAPPLSINIDYIGDVVRPELP